MKGSEESILQRLLESGYRSFDPQGAFRSIAITRALLEHLLPESVFEQAKDGTSVLAKDLCNYRAQSGKEWDDDAIHCQFVYFATSMVHVFGKSAVTYIVPNVPIPYIWINVISDIDIELINFSNRLERDIFRIIMHVVYSPGKIETIKKSIHLRSNGLIMTFSTGHAIQLCLRLDLEEPLLSMSAANPTLPNCVVLLSYRGTFVGAWHKGKEKLICAIH